MGRDVLLRGDAPGKRVRAAQHLVREHAPRVEIGAMIHRVTQCLFRRHVRGCAQRIAGLREGGVGAARAVQRARGAERLGDAKVGDDGGSPDNRMLSGLMSRWTMPSPCAYASARTTSRTMLTPSDSGIFAPAVKRARNDTPRTNGIVYQAMPLVSPAARTGRMFACCRRAASRTSRVKRSALSP